MINRESEGGKKERKEETGWKANTLPRYKKIHQYRVSKSHEII